MNARPMVEPENVERLYLFSIRRADLLLAVDAVSMFMSVPEDVLGERTVSPKALWSRV